MTKGISILSWMYNHRASKDFWTFLQLPSCLKFRTSLKSPFLLVPPDWVQNWNWSVFGMSFLYMGQETTISHGFCDLNQSELSIQILLLRNYNNKIHFNYNSNNQMEQILYITDKLSLYASNLKCFQSKHKIQCLAHIACTNQ